MVALFAGAVGVGIHVLNKEARAELVEYTIYVYEMVDGLPVPVNNAGVLVDICVDQQMWGQFSPAALGNGLYSFWWDEDDMDFWRIIMPASYELIDPDSSPQARQPDVHFMSWKVNC